MSAAMTIEPVQLELSVPDSVTPGRPIRVLHVTNVETENYYLNNLVDHTDRREAQLFAATFGRSGSFVEGFENRGARAFALDCMSRRRYREAARRLREIIQSEKIDLIHTHLFEPTLVAMSAARSLKKKVIVTRHHSDALYRIPNTLKRMAYLAAERWINRNAAHIIAPSQMVWDILVERESVPEEKLSLIPYPQTAGRFDGVRDTDVERVRHELNMHSSLALVCISRLSIEKGHRYLFDAFSRIVRDGLDATLYLAGEGPYKEAIQGFAKVMGIEGRVRFLGWRTDALALVKAADIVVHPSLQEALPSAVIEAVMLEQPMVATDVSGVRDIAGDSQYAVVVSPADADAFYEGLVRTIDDMDAARARARAGRRFILDYMDPHKVTEQYLGCYRRISGNLNGN